MKEGYGGRIVNKEYLGHGEIGETKSQDTGVIGARKEMPTFLANLEDLEDIAWM